MSEKKEKTGLKSFNEMMEIDLTKYVQKKPTFFKDKATGKLKKTSPDKWLDYIEWGMVLALLYKNGASQVTFCSKLSEEKPNTLDIFVNIDNNEYSLQYPLINGNAIITNANQLDIHKSELRGFVKCVAIHTGLGLKLWLNEEKSLEDAPSEKKEEKKLPEFTSEMFEKAKNSNATIEKIKKFYSVSEEIEEDYNEYLKETTDATAQ